MITVTIFVAWFIIFAQPNYHYITTPKVEQSVNDQAILNDDEEVIVLQKTGAYSFLKSYLLNDNPKIFCGKENPPI